MSARNARYLLIAAFLISLLLHLLLAFNLHPHADEAPTDIEVVRIEHRPSELRIAKTPPPPPPKPPQHARTPPPLAPPAPKRTAAAATAKPASNGTTGTALQATPAPAPTPAATLAAANPCGRNDAGAAVVTEPTPPVIPVSARAEGTSGTTVVNVALDAKGDVSAATVAQTSGSQALDLIAIGMARGATYSPALHDCKPVAAAYQFSVRFAAW